MGSEFAILTVGESWAIKKPHKLKIDNKYTNLLPYSYLINNKFVRSISYDFPQRVMARINIPTMYIYSVLHCNVVYANIVIFASRKAKTSSIFITLNRTRSLYTPLNGQYMHWLQYVINKCMQNKELTLSKLTTRCKTTNFFL